MQWKTNRLNDLRKQYAAELTQYYNKNEAEALVSLLIKFFFGSSRIELAFNPAKRLSESEMLKLHFAIRDLKKFKPVQYIIGEVEFLDFRFKVNEYVLIPRPETEEMVSHIVKSETNSNLRIFDIGTGTGCIAITLQKKLDHAKVSAVDFSNEILSLAKENAVLNHAQVEFQMLDILNPTENVEMEDQDIIVSNPPYVTNIEKNRMKKNVLLYEPHQALFVPDEDPLLFYKAILTFAQKHLKSNGRLYFEINEKMGSEVKKILEKNNYQEVTIYRDINGKDRFVRAVKTS